MACRRFVGALWVSTMLFAQAIGAAPNATGAPSLACSTELQPLVQAERWADLERSARELATRLQARLGAAAPEVVRAANCVIVALKAQNRSGEAQAIAQHQIYAATVLTGAHSIDTITAEGSLSDSLLALHRPADAEALLRAALKTHEAALGPKHELIAVSLTQLSTVLKVERRFADAEQLMRRAVSIEEKLPGPERPELANYVTLLAGTQISQGHFAEADLLLQRAIAINERVMGVDSMATAVSLQDAATMTLQEGRYADTEQLYRRMLGISHKLFGAESPKSVIVEERLATAVEEQGRYEEAESLFRHVLAIRESAIGPEDSATAGSMNNLGNLLERENHHAEAEALLKRALAVEAKATGEFSWRVAMPASNLGMLMVQQRRYQEAEPLLRYALAIDEKTQGAGNPLIAEALSKMAALLQAQGKLTEAEPLLRRAVSICKFNGAEAPDTGVMLGKLATNLSLQHRYAESDSLFAQSLAIEEKTLDATHPDVATTRRSLADSFVSQKKWADAARQFRLACSARSAFSSARDLSGDAAQSALYEANSCWIRLGLSLATWAQEGGGTAPGDKPLALFAEAFNASQRAVQSAAGAAMARSTAMAAAKAAGVGTQAEAYEAALLSRDQLDQQFAKSEFADQAQGVEQRAVLTKTRIALSSRIDSLAADLKARASLYWDFRSPEPLSIGALQSRSGADAALLRDNEALIDVLLMPGGSNGLVFAVSKQGAAWARVGLTGADLQERVSRLRRQIDPEGYRLPDAPTSGSDAAAGAFERDVAYEVYRALLGDPAIQSVIRDKPVLLFVPSGPLTMLPPALLVTTPPAGGRNADQDPDALRATSWLLRSKAVAVLPSVSSLRMLRQILPAARSVATDPVLVFADPNFARPKVAKKPELVAAARSLAAYFRDGVPIAEELDDVPSLPGTRVEGEAIVRALKGQPGSLLTGNDASKAQLMRRNADGRLSRVRVLEFATHGLVAGDASDLAEPALVLAAGATPSDELLLASEASQLKLNADWVLLSACNTASPDAPEAQGLSGLSRAFFYAGARSLLVSHWRVRDDVAPMLIPAMLMAEREHPEMSRAQALQMATLAVLDNRALNAADPASWAPFTLIGEAAR
jgi:CHAT domain-containing protein/tetratricopeptide (TPR) repeat protein